MLLNMEETNCNDDKNASVAEVNANNAHYARSTHPHRHAHPSLQLQQSKGSAKTSSTSMTTASVIESNQSSTVSADNQYFDQIRNYVANNLDKEKDQHKLKAIAMRNRSIKFPVRLMYSLDHSDQGIFTWSGDGKSFIIKDKTRLEKEVLPKNFKDAKFNSFLRKLYRWGFVKKSENQKDMQYFHKKFQKENYSLCMDMTCTDSTKARSIRIQEEIASFQAKKEMKRSSIHTNLSATSTNVNPTSVHIQQQQMINQLKAQNDLLLSQLINNTTMSQDYPGQIMTSTINNSTMPINNPRLTPSVYQGLPTSSPVDPGLPSSYLSINQALSSSSTNHGFSSCINPELSSFTAAPTNQGLALSVNHGLSSLLNQSLMSTNDQLFGNTTNNQAFPPVSVLNTQLLQTVPNTQDFTTAMNARALNAQVMNGLNRWNNSLDAISTNPLNTYPANNLNNFASPESNDHLYEKLQQMMESQNLELQDSINQESAAKRQRTEGGAKFQKSLRR